MDSLRAIAVDSPLSCECVCADPSNDVSLPRPPIFSDEDYVRCACRNCGPDIGMERRCTRLVLPLAMYMHYYFDVQRSSIPEYDRTRDLTLCGECMDCVKTEKMKAAVRRMQQRKRMRQEGVSPSDASRSVA